jgi:hypothetical protein
MPIVYSYLGLTDQEYIKRKREKLKIKKARSVAASSNIYMGIEEEDERLSK